MSMSAYLILIALFIVYLGKISRHSKYRKWAIFMQALFIIAAVRYSIERVKPWQPRCVKPDYRIEMESLLELSKTSAETIVLCNEPNYLEARFYYNMLGYKYLDDKVIEDIKNQGFIVFENRNGKYVKR